MSTNKYQQITPVCDFFFPAMWRNVAQSASFKKVESFSLDQKSHLFILFIMVNHHLSPGKWSCFAGQIGPPGRTERSPAPGTMDDLRPAKAHSMLPMMWEIPWHPLLNHGFWVMNIGWGGIGQFDDILDHVCRCQGFVPAWKGKTLVLIFHIFQKKQIPRKLPPAINPMISCPLPWQKPICRTSSSCLIFKSQLAFLGFRIAACQSLFYGNYMWFSLPFGADPEWWANNGQGRSCKYGARLYRRFFLVFASHTGRFMYIYISYRYN